MINAAPCHLLETLHCPRLSFPTESLTVPKTFLDSKGQGVALDSLDKHACELALSAQGELHGVQAYGLRHCWKGARYGDEVSQAVAGLTAFPFLSEAYRSWLGPMSEYPKETLGMLSYLFSKSDCTSAVDRNLNSGRQCRPSTHHVIVTWASSFQST